VQEVLVEAALDVVSLRLGPDEEDQVFVGGGDG
jgi:hypothetical protein